MRGKTMLANNIFGFEYVIRTLPAMQGILELGFNATKSLPNCFPSMGKK
jgi:hypothetical protein